MKFTDKYGDVKVMSLSFKQPYAQMMLHGKHETRTRDTNVRGWVLICASLKPYGVQELLNISGHTQYSRIEDALKGVDGSLCHGEAIAIGYLTATKWMGDYYGNKDSMAKIEDKCFVKYNSDLWIHEYEDVQAIEPFHWKGTQGWKNLDQETKDKIILL